MAQPVGRSNGGPFAGPPSYLTSLRCASFKVDEGYSEDTRSQSENDTVMRSDSRLGDMSEHDSSPVLPDWLIGLSETERSELTYAILRTLRTSSIASIVDRLNPLLHLDPVTHLPPEITSLIFSYLTPKHLLQASSLSKSWRGRALDSQLWRLLFRLEGWTTNLPRVRSFEEEERTRRLGLRERKIRARRADGDAERQTKKRAYEGGVFGDGPSDRPTPMNIEEYVPTMNDWAEQHGRVEADGSNTSSPDRMQDVAFHGSGQDTDMAQFARPSLPLDPPLEPSLLLTDNNDNPRINWHYLYKQKKRLEDNWNAGQYVNFQFPHKDFPNEAHTECVYTIQYSVKHLVSGSRDKSVRIWDMETQRLVRSPLLGHSASVLCLQFDDSPKEDVVISGGSDCHVIIWRFSTGIIIKKLPRAHSESVLNLRFDENYLITCSKDKTIKVWSRKELMPTDSAYPTSTKSQAKFPSYIINMEHVHDPTQHLQVKALPEYSLIMTLEGHSAAVNAIQIYEGQIVSASGDRNVKIWDVKTGQCAKTLPGHAKGIACVQFDGRRIVSGSSDETVRIFDRITGAEVARLHGHTNLVRTVQASFGDLPGNEEELEAEARKVDEEYFEARDRGELDNHHLSRERRRARNAGSRDPRDLFAVGAKLPPGGGGSRWARIVSGSYDESVIIWKKNLNGEWVPGQVLQQNDAVRSAASNPRRAGQAARQHNQNHAQGQATAGQQQAPAQNNGNNPATNAQNTVSQLATVQANFQALAAQAHAQVAHAQMLAQQATALQQQTQQAQAQQAAQAAVTQQQQQNQQAQQQTHQAIIAATTSLNAAQTAQAQTQQTANNQTTTATSASTTQQQAPAQTTTTTTTTAAAPAVPVNPPPPQPHHHHHHAHGHHHHHHPLGGLGGGQQGGTNSRVFKLQFDARRIICCSQDPTIVGWDFANGDPDIVGASRFFGELL